MKPRRFHAAIAPVPETSERPLWSVVIPTYNCAAFLGSALDSVLSQYTGPEQMEIIVVDDSSDQDDPAEVVAQRGGRIAFIRQKENVGKARNYETGISRSLGRLIHLLHGDDRVRPGFYKTMEEAFAAYPDAGAFFSRSAYIDERGSQFGQTGEELPNVGVVDNWLEKIVVQQRIQAPSMVVRREVYESLGGFDARLAVFEDWEMWIRIANAYPVGFVPQLLAEYRVSSSNSSTTSMLAGTRTAVLRSLIEIVDSYLPRSVVENCREERNREMAQYLTQFIPPLMQRGHTRAVARVYADVLSFSRHPRTLYRLVNYTARYKRLLGG